MFNNNWFRATYRSAKIHVYLYVLYNMYMKEENTVNNTGFRATFYSPVNIHI